MFNLLSNLNKTLVKNVINWSKLNRTSRASYYSTDNKKKRREEEEIKNKILYYLDNELPDKSLDLKLQHLKAEIKAQAIKVRQLKAQKINDKSQLETAIAELKTKKCQFKDQINHLLIESNDQNNEQEIHQKFFEDILVQRFFYDSSFSIYGGSSGFIDLGPLGCAIRDNIKDEWKKFFILNDHMLQIECSIITPEIALKASGHLSKFSDLMVRDVITGDSFRVDHLLKQELEKRLNKESSVDQELKDFIHKIEHLMIENNQQIDLIIQKYKIKSPITGNDLSNVTNFNLMFSTTSGPFALQKR
jgi:glycyl-tRNA synthetase